MDIKLVSEVVGSVVGVIILGAVVVIFRSIILDMIEDNRERRKTQRICRRNDGRMKSVYTTSRNRDILYTHNK